MFTYKLGKIGKISHFDNRFVYIYFYINLSTLDTITLILVKIITR